MTGERPLTTCTAACPACPCQTWGRAHTICPSGPPGVRAGDWQVRGRPPRGQQGPAGASRGGRRGPQPEAGPLPTPVPPAPRPAPPFMLRAPRLRRHVLDRAGGSRAPPDAGVPSAASRRRLLGVSTSLPGHGLAVSTCEVPATLSREYRFCPSNAWRVPRSVAALRVLSLSPGLPGTPRTAPDTFARCTDMRVPRCRALGSGATGPCSWVSKLSARLGLE